MKMGTLSRVVFTVLLALALAPMTRAQAPGAVGNSPAASSTSPVTGDWKAVVQRDGNPLHVILHIAVDKSGTLLATIDAIEMQANDVVVSNMLLKGDKLTFDVDQAPGSYAGTLSKDATEIDGTWTGEDGAGVPMNFTKDTAATSAPAETAPAAPAQPAAPPQQ